MRRNRRAAALLVAALALVTLGQVYFFHRPDYLWDGLVFHLLGAACFLLAWRALSPRPGKGRRVRERAPSAPWSLPSLPTVLLVLGLFFSAIAALLTRDRAVSEATYDVVACWLAGLAAALLAAFWPASAVFRVPCLEFRVGRLRGWLAQDWRGRLRAVKREAWLEIGAVVAVTFVAFVTRAVSLARIPYTLGGDEAWHGLLARQVLQGEMRNPFSMGYMSMPTFFYWPLSWCLWLAGDGLAGLRLPAALVGTLTVPALYLLAKHLWGRRTALLAALLLAGYDYHIHYSRLGANNAWDPLLAVLVFWLVERGLGQVDPARRRQAFILAGLILGLAVYFYTGARLLPVMVALYLAFAWWRGRSQASAGPAGTGMGRPLLWLALALLIAAGPMLSFALAHPAEWNARLNQVGILQSGWLEREPELTGKSTLQILGEQFLRAAGAFHVFPDRTVWYGATRPLLGFLPGVLALLGLAWAFAHWRERRHFLLLLWFWGVILTGGMLTESPPSSQRLVLAIPPVMLLTAIGLEQVVSLAARLFSTPDTRSTARVATWQNLALGGLALAIAAGSVGYYFFRFTPERRYGSANAETATMIGYYLREVEDDAHVYFLGAPRIYWSFGTMTFLAPQVTGEDILDPLAAPPDLADREEKAAFVLLPERAGELPWIQEALPGGGLYEFSDRAGAVRFLAYQAP